MVSSYFPIFVISLALFVVIDAAVIKPTGRTAQPKPAETKPAQTQPAPPKTQEEKNLHNVKLANDLLDNAKKNIILKANQVNQNVKNVVLAKDVYIWIQNMLKEVEVVINRNWFWTEKEFTMKKLGDPKASKAVFDKLKQDIENLRSTTKKISESVVNMKEDFKRLVKEAIDAGDYLTAAGFKTCIEKTRDEIIQMYKSQPGDDQLKTILQPKLEKTIDNLPKVLEKIHLDKRNSFKAKIQPALLKARMEVRQSFERNLRAQSNGSYNNDNDFERLFERIKQNSLTQFDAALKNGDEISVEVHQDFRKALERDFDRFKKSVRGA